MLRLLISEVTLYVLDHSFCLADLTIEARGHAKLGETRGHLKRREVT